MLYKIVLFVDFSCSFIVLFYQFYASVALWQMALTILIKSMMTEDGVMPCHSDHKITYAHFHMH